MNLIDFIKEYPDEAACKAKFKEYREQVGFFVSALPVDGKKQGEAEGKSAG